MYKGPMCTSVPSAQISKCKSVQVYKCLSVQVYKLVSSLTVSSLSSK